MVQKDGGFKITGMQLHLLAEVDGIDEDTFQKLERQADKGWALSKLLRQGLEIEIVLAMLGS